MNRACLSLLVATLVLSLGCAGSDSGPVTESPETSQVDERIALAAEIARAVEADPDAAEEILASHDITIEQFEEMMYEISANPELTKAYEAALAN
jgi:hypothetical protein